MADGILGLGSKGSAGLNQDLIDKLKKADEKAKVDPYTTKLEDWDKELKKITEIESATKDLLSSLSDFDLNNSSANAFEQVAASTTGTSASFNAVDVAGLTAGSNTVTISQLAQRDVYQTATVDDADSVITTDDDKTMTIKVGGESYDFDLTNTTYSQLTDNINQNEHIIASMEQVGDSSYRLVIKSKDTGVDNALDISTSDGVDLGFSTTMTSKRYDSTTATLEEDDSDQGSSKITINVDGDDYDIDTHNKSLEDVMSDINDTDTLSDKVEASIVDNKLVLKNKDSDTNYNIGVTEDNISMGFSNAILKAQNMKSSIDGVDYDVASNTITIQGNLSMTAIEKGTSTISVQQDNSQIMPAMQDFVDKYNTLADLVNNELYPTEDGDKSSIKDTSTIKSMLDSIKEKLFGSYGKDNDESLFNNGFNLDQNGVLSLDTTKFSENLATNFEGMKSLFVGTAENPGFGTELQDYMDSLDDRDGLLTNYADAMAKRKTTLEDNKKKEQDILDSKYSLMAQQFASYTAMITSMENSFSGMKMMIDSNNSSK
jgi:flagellar hook-associated protein 2